MSYAMSRTPWDASSVERLGELWPDNSASQISAALVTEFRRGFTKNAVIGKAKRLGLSSKPSPLFGGQHKHYAKDRTNRRAVSTTALRAVEKRQREAFPAPRLVVTVKSLPPVTSDPYEQRERRRLAFEQMTDSKGCKFPVGDPLHSDFHFCCAPRSSPSYCPDHHAITHKPAESATNVARPRV